jgi:succinate dehydrogenase / fumarate reductase iron-sulfur subunit
MHVGASEVHLRLWRGDAGGGEFKNYRLNAAEGMVVLDAVREVQAQQAGDLAVRWNCKAGKCGSCSAEINGLPRLMCMTRMNALPEGPVTVGPLRAFPVIRDLVTDVAFNYAKAAGIPLFQPAPADADGKRRMFQEDVERIQEFHRCIECFLCQDACHVIRDHSRKRPDYSGPRSFVRIAALEMHPLDAGDRVGMLKGEAGIGLCNVTKCCTEVCPEQIRITDNAIIPLKERVADRYYDPIAAFFRRFRRKA